MSEVIAIIISVLKVLLTIHIPYYFDLYGTPFLVGGLVWYGWDYDQFSGFQRGIFILCVISSAIRIWMIFALIFSNNKGIDGIGEALGKVIILNYARMVSIITAIVLFVTCTISFAQGPLIIGGVFVCTVLFIVWLNIPEYIRRSKITITQVREENMHSVKEFEDELISRKLLTEQGMMYGIDKDSKEYKQLDVLSWDKDANKKYPAYMYVFGIDNYLDKDAIDEEILRRHSWLGFDKKIYFYIYYINGQITAVPAACWKQFYERNIMAMDLIFSETERVYVYDFKKNKYIYLAEKDGIGSKYVSLYDKSQGKLKYELDFLNKSSYYSEYMCVAFLMVDQVNLDSITQGFKKWAYQKKMEKMDE